MRILSIAFLFFFLNANTVFAQVVPYQQDFIQYLLNNKMHDEAISVLKDRLALQQVWEQRDSTYYLLGKTLYRIQRLNESITFFDSVSIASTALYNEAAFFSAFSKTYLGDIAGARKRLNHVNFSDKRENNLKYFQLAGMSLLNSDWKQYDSIRQEIVQTDPTVSAQLINLDSHKEKIKELNKKSMLKAGLLSTVVPGLGKVYAGRRGNGLYSFLMTGLLFAQTHEAYRKNGTSSARFIIYSSLLTSFYIGNIWGSALSVRVIRNERYDSIKDQVLFDMHIPLRTIFQ